MGVKISIIVGLYNVSRFLIEKRLLSIFNQTYSDWELILVNDGSTDNTGEICDSFASGDNRIKVIHKTNGGLGSARNAGLDVARGEYVWFYDVDDDADEALLSKCVDEIEKDETELLVFGFKAVDLSSKVEDLVVFKNKRISDQEQLKECYIDDLLLVKHGNGFAWNKFYRRSFIEEFKIRYANQRIQQDEVFNLEILKHVKKVSLCSDVLYTYYIYSQGNTRSNFIKDRFDIYKSIFCSFMTIKHLWDISDERFDRYVYARFFNGIGQCLRFNLFHKKCIWTLKEKNIELNRVIKDELSVETFEYMSRNSRLTAEDIVFLNVYKVRSVLLLKIVDSIVGLVKTIKHAIC